MNVDDRQYRPGKIGFISFKVSYISVNTDTPDAGCMYIYEVWRKEGGSENWTRAGGRWARSLVRTGNNVLNVQLR